MFSTKDRDNDIWSAGHCALKYKGAWWYKNCHNSNLNGQYLRGKHNKFGRGVEWEYWRGEYYSFEEDWDENPAWFVLEYQRCTCFWCGTLKFRQFPESLKYSQ